MTAGAIFSSARPVLRLGTRGSLLARRQTDMVRAALLAARPDLRPDQIEIVTYTTSGDRIQDRPLTEAGGKGLFTKELEEALLRGEIDAAVHSMKDMPTVLPTGLALAAFLPREDVRDCLILSEALQGATRLQDLPPGLRFGTSSIRRRAQIAWARPDFHFVDFRGNVDTRLRKIADGVADATLLARAGLNRLGLMPAGAVTLPVENCLPAPAQGAVGIECRADDAAVWDAFAVVDDRPTRIQVTAERALLGVLDGSCRTPIAALAELGPGDALRLRGEILRPDGRERHRVERTGLAQDAARLGQEAGEELKRHGGPAFFIA